MQFFFKYQVSFRGLRFIFVFHISIVTSAEQFQLEENRYKKDIMATYSYPPHVGILNCNLFFSYKMKYFDKLPAFLAEFIGTGLLLFFGCAGCVTWNGNTHLQIVLNFGLAVMFVVQIFACISGAHFNPAVTIAAFICKKVDMSTAVIYFLAQLFGSFVGFGLLMVVTPESQFSRPSLIQNGTAFELCRTFPATSVSSWQAVLIEFIATAVLILTCCACAWDKRNANHHDSLPLRFGLTVSGLACAVVSVKHRFFGYNLVKLV